MPKLLPDLMRLPVIAVVEEVKAIQVWTTRLPTLWVKRPYTFR
jgi:hypothetical protein